MRINSPAFIAPVIALTFSICSGSAARAQREIGPLRLASYRPEGLRGYVTEASGTFKVEVTNSGQDARDARAVVFYTGQEDVQYSRNIWVPPQSTMSIWIPAGPAPPQTPGNRREIQALLYDRTGGTEQLLLPETDERVRGRVVTYRRREQSTAILLDDPPPRSDPDAREDFRPPPALLLARTMRLAGSMSQNVSVVAGGPLPPMPAAFDGIDHIVVAGRRLAADPSGAAALRHWLQHGGKLWIMLDRVDPAVVGPILGDELDFEVVDRISLSTIRLHRSNVEPAKATPIDLEQPVDMVRVLTGANDRVVHIANGWPASFVRPLGRGKVIFTTLAAEGWFRPRVQADGRSPFMEFPDQPVPLLPLQDLSGEFQSRSPVATPELDKALRRLLTEEIGYTVPGRPTAAIILGGFVLALVALGVGLRRSRRPELVGWLAPVAALVATGLFVALGESSRRAVPPTVAAAAIVDAVPGNGEAAVNGMFAIYQPASGVTPIGTNQGATLDLNTKGLEGQLRRRVHNDIGNWRWEGLSLPAGVRDGPYAQTLRTGPLAALARFGPSGIEGRLLTGPYRHLADALIITPAREALAVRLGADDSFAAGPADTLPPGQFLAGTVLTDRQQRRQEVYRQLLSGALPEHLEGRDLLLAWAEPPDVPFTSMDDARVVGTALLVLPLEFERVAVKSPVTIPSAFVPYRRVLSGLLQRPRLEDSQAVDMRLRFQLPPSLLPLTVERATLVARVRAPGWRFSITGESAGRTVPLVTTDSPAGEPVRVEIADANLLQTDAQGGLHVNVAMSGGSPDVRWRIESISLEVVGVTGAAAAGTGPK